MTTPTPIDAWREAGAALLRGEKPDEPTAFPFAWGPCWHFVTEYAVDDLEVELGFYAEALGFVLWARDEGYAMLASPDQKAFLGLRQAGGDVAVAPPSSVKVGLLLEDILGTQAELASRGLSFEQAPTPWAEGAPMYRGQFRTPHGVAVELWGMVAAPKGADEAARAPAEG